MASHNSLAPLETLPTEILQMILSQMNCTDDLSAAINASPRILQCFLGRREEILIRAIQSSLAPAIFMEVLGMVDVPNFGNLHYVPGPDVAPLLVPGSEGSTTWWAFLRLREQERLAGQFWDFQGEIFKRLSKGLERGAPQPFPIPGTTRPLDREQLARSRREVNTVVTIFAKLKRHMGTLRRSVPPEASTEASSYIWVPGTYSSRELEVMHTWDSPTVGLRNVLHVFSVNEHRRFLRDLLWEKLMGKTS